MDDSKIDDSTIAAAQTIEEIERIRDELQADADVIKFQLDGADVGRDKKWEARARFALRKKNAQIQRLARKVGEFRREERSEKARSIYRYFVDAARRRLQEDVFNDLMDEAHQILAMGARDDDNRGR